jgi:adenosine deaminase
MPAGGSAGGRFPPRRSAPTFPRMQHLTRLRTRSADMRIHRTIRPALAAALLCLPAATHAQSPEARTERYFDAIRGNTPLLYAFLREMPKGADLHSHLSGAVYAESFLRWAAEDGLCVGLAPLRIAAACTPPDTTRAAAIGAGVHDALVDAMSMRNWHPARINGHDQFFSTFGRLDALPRRSGDMLAEAQARAADGSLQYLELMMTIDGRAARTLGQRAGWSGDLGRMRDTLLALGMREAAAAARLRLDSVEARRDSVLQCGTAAAEAGCAVTVRWLYQVARAGAPEQVFAQILMGFLLTEADPRVVGFNLVQPEDNPVAMRDYSLHMRMIGHLRAHHPGVRVTLHAGELAPGLVPPEGLRFHVREAVEVAGASRIGHGVGVMYEDRPHDLLAAMARRGVMVEVNLTSNDVILGIRGADHPLHAYLAAGVPVALSTDDEGVARSEITMEYVKAVREQGLGYRTLKRMARTGLEHAFVEEAEKRRLLREFDAAVGRFEARYGAVPVPTIPALN